MASLAIKLKCKECQDSVPDIIEDFKNGDLGIGLLIREANGGRLAIQTKAEMILLGTFLSHKSVGAASDPLLGSNHLESTLIAGGTTAMGKDLAKLHSRTSQVRGEKHLEMAFKEIQAMCERIGLSRLVIDSAKQLYKKVEDEKVLRGKTQEAIMASCIYIACREQNVTRTFKEIYALTKVSKKEIGRCFKVLQGLLSQPAQQISLDSYISRFGSFLDMPIEAQKGSFTADSGALAVARKVTDLGVLAGKSPISLVAASLYFQSCLSSLGKSAKEIADISGCTENTLKNAYKLVFEARDQIVSDADKAKIINLPVP